MASDISYRHTPTPGFGPVLRRARKARGWTYRAAAKHIGIATGYLCELEHGRRCPSETVAGLLVSVLGLGGADAALVWSEAVPDVGRDFPGRGGR